ncbi:phage tail tape measure protein [Shewanella sp. KX20019]|uniref:phage tail tape measure protein n=1 Tax=Shewanella sp. KX20019 TaxID=2803864 RepID=UPI0019269D98|nr:phage tail tape measure protein [Shewanella sp. KX20019]QQX80861.1 phage tail tape measure protein [Shewanella sp. KX20019]
MAATNNLVLQLQLDSQDFQEQLNNEKRTITKWASDISKKTGRMLKTVAVAPFKFIKEQLFSIKGLLLSTFSLAGIGGFFKKTSDSVKEMQKLAKFSQLTTDEFQKLSFAASTVGVEASRVADFMNDALLKINEYIKEGSGEGANIVKMLQQAGYSLEQIQKLKGEALFDAISDAAAKTGIDVKTLNRYLDELASDPGVELSSVFTYDREKFKKAMKDFKDLGIALDQDLLKASDDTRGAWLKLTAIIEKFSQIYYASLGPVLEFIAQHLTNLLTETAKSEGGFKALGLTLASQTVGALKDAITFVRELVGQFKYGIYQVQEVANKFGADFDFVDDPFKKQKENIDNIGISIDAIDPKLKKQKKLLSDLDRQEASQRGYYLEGQQAEYQAQRDSINNEIEALKKQKKDLAIQKGELLKALESGQGNLSSSDFTPEAGKVETFFKEAEVSLNDKATEAAKTYKDAVQETTDETEKAKDAVEGTKSAFDQVKQNIDDTFRQEGVASIQRFGGAIENTFMDMLNGGKLNFKALADFVIQELQRMMIKAMIVKPIMDSLTTAFGSFTGEAAGEKAAGGPISGGQSYLIGEQGPELFTPYTSGNITPNNKLGGGGGGVSVNIINNSGEKAEAETRDEGGDKIIDVIIGQAKAAISDDISRGTGVAKVFEGKYGLNRKSF